MLILKTLKRFNALRLIDRFYSGGEFLNLKPSIQKELILWYLNQDYNRDSINMALIFDYICNVIQEGLFSFAEIDELIINSRFAKSMSSDDVFDILTTNPKTSVLNNIPKFIKFCLEKISDPIMLYRIISYNSDLDERLVRARLTELGNIDSIIKIDYYTTTSNPFNLGLDIALSNEYSVDDLKNYCIRTYNRSINEIVEWFATRYSLTDEQEEKDHVLDALLEVAKNEDMKGDTTHQSIELKKEENLRGYKDFAYAINKSERLHQDAKNNLAIKIYESGIDGFLYEWLNKVKCDANYTIIDGLLMEGTMVIFSTFLCLDDEAYLTYFLDHLMLCDIAKITAVLSIFFNGCGDVPLFKTEMVLDKLFASYPNYKIKKEKVLKLLCVGTKYTEVFFKDYEFNAEERKIIINSYIENNLTHLLTIYGLYLMTGDKSKIASSDTLDIDLEELKLMRENKEGTSS